MARQSRLSTLIADTLVSADGRAYAGSNGAWCAECVAKPDGWIMHLAHYSTHMLSIANDSVYVIDPGYYSASDKTGINKILKGWEPTQRLTYWYLYGDEGDFRGSYRIKLAKMELPDNRKAVVIPKKIKKFSPPVRVGDTYV